VNDQRRTSSNDPLDELLAQARWFEAKLDAHARLATAYRAERSRIGRRRTLVRSAFALAASVLIVISAVRFMRFDRATKHAGSLTVQPVKRERVTLEPRVPVVVRPLTNMETAIIATQRPRKVETAPIAMNLPIIVDVSAIARELNKPDLASERRQVLLAQLVQEGSARSMQIFLDSVGRGPTRADSLAALDRLKNPPIEKFIAALQDPVVDRRIAAARALGYINGPALTSRLIRMAESDLSRREVMVALACSRGEAAQKYLKHASESGPMVSLARSVRVQFDVQ
jgi:hypothetical protein